MSSFWKQKVRLHKCKTFSEFFKLLSCVFSSDIRLSYCNSNVNSSKVLNYL